MSNYNIDNDDNRNIDDNLPNKFFHAKLKYCINELIRTENPS